MKRILFFGLTLLSGLAMAQTSIIWHFGANVNMDFKTDPPTASCNSSILTAEGSSGITDNAGNDIFYTDGSTIWDKNGNPMPNGSGLGGDASSTSAALVVPDPGNDDRYYVFTTDQTEDAAAGNGVNYYIVDMTLRSGLGDVIIPSDNPIYNVTSGSFWNTEKLTAAPKLDGTGYWIIIGAQRERNIVYAYDLTDAGLNMTPVISNTQYNLHAQGYLKSNRSGTMLVSCSKDGDNSKAVELLGFDPFTGSITSRLKLDVQNYGFAYGAEFSPDGNTLYISNLSPGQIYKYDLTAADIPGSGELIASDIEIGALSIAPNGKIYFARNNGNFYGRIGVINDPDNFANPDVDLDGIILGGGCGAWNGGYRGLPTFVSGLVYSGCTPPLQIDLSTNSTDLCEGQSATLTADENIGFNYYWLNADNGDTLASGSGMNEYVVNTTGNYEVRISNILDLNEPLCSKVTETVTITAHQDPTLTGTIQGPDTVCEGATGEIFTLNDPNNGDYSGFNWQPLNNGASYTNTNNQTATVSFAGVTNPPKTINIAVSVEETHGSTVCESNEISKNVVVEATQTVELNATTSDVACESTGNTFTISNYDSRSTYTLSGVPSGWTASINGDVITFDVNGSSGSITVNQETANGCSGTSATHTATVLGCGLEAIFEVTDDACSSDTITFDASNSDAGNGSTITSYVWTFPSEITPITPTDQVTVDAVVSNTGTSPINVSVTLVVGNSIGMSDDTVRTDVITINPVPGTISILQSGLVCEGEEAIFKVDPYDPASTYTWTTTETKGNEAEDSLVITNGSDNYTVSVVETKFGCSGAEATTNMTVELTPELVLSETAMTVLCSSTGNSFTITSYNASSAYAVTGNVLNINRVDETITFDVAENGGTITVTETTANGCVSSSESVNITTIGCELKASFTVSNEICAGDTLIFIDNSDPGNIAFTITDYNWDFGDTNILKPITDTTLGTVSVVVLNNGQSPLQATVSLSITNSVDLSDDTTATNVITINPKPLESAIVWNGLVCEAEQSEFGVTPKSGSYNWGSTNPNFVQNNDTAHAVNGTSNYSVWFTQTNEYGCVNKSDTLDVEIELNPTLEIDPTAITANCSSDSNLALITNYNAANIYTATGTDVTATVSNDSILIDVEESNGSVVVAMESANGCPAEDVTINLTIVGCGLEANFTVDVEACSGETILFVSTSNPGNNATVTNYNWTFPADIEPITSPLNNDSIYAIVNNSGTEPISITATLEITTSANLTAEITKVDVSTINPVPSDLSLMVEGGSCPKDTSTFKFAPYNSNSTYLWNTGGAVSVTQRDSTNIIINSDNDYTVSVHEINEYGCESETDATLLRKVNPRPSNIQGVFGDASGCPGLGSELEYGYYVSADNASTYNWTASEDFGGLFVSGQTSDSTVVNLPTLPGESIELFVTIGNDNCAWDTTLSTTVNIDSIFSLSVEFNNPNICEEDGRLYEAILTVNDEVRSNFNESYSVEWTLNDETISDSLSATISAVTEGDELSFSFSPNFCYNTSSSFDITKTLEVVDRPGGELSLDGQVGTYKLEGVTSLPTIALNDEYAIDRVNAGIPNPTQYQWMYIDPISGDTTSGDMVPSTLASFNQGTPPIGGQGEYDVQYLMVTTNDICYDTSIAILTINLDIFVPDAFSPNDDGTFDVLIIENIENYPDAQVQIFNRWGNEVYDSGQGGYTPWDGTKDGELLPTGTYFYIISLTDELKLNGDVSLLK